METISPNGTVHCFNKTKQHSPYVPPEDVSNPANITRIHQLFNVIAHTQINVNSRVNILQKVLAKYPEFRHNLGAQALIRDSVLFNTLHHPEVVKNISETYPIICEAAPFMVDTIKKELARSSSTTRKCNISYINVYFIPISIVSEPATDSTNSSEEENSMGASTSNERPGSGTQSENSRIRMISRQQLQAALARIGVGSVNSLSNIAQRNSDNVNVTPATGTTSEAAVDTSAPLSNSTSGERISSTMFRSELQRALESLSQRGNQVSSSGSGNSDQVRDLQEMDTTEATIAHNVTEDGSDELPPQYRTHQYANELRTMIQMGLLNYDDNLVYLTIASGNIDVAINLLMGAMN